MNKHIVDILNEVYHDFTIDDFNRVLCSQIIKHKILLTQESILDEVDHAMAHFKINEYDIVKKIIDFIHKEHYNTNNGELRNFFYDFRYTPVIYDSVVNVIGNNCTVTVFINALTHFIIKNKLRLDQRRIIKEINEYLNTLNLNYESESEMMQRILISVYENINSIETSENDGNKAVKYKLLFEKELSWYFKKNQII